MSLEDFCEDEFPIDLERLFPRTKFDYSPQSQLKCIHQELSEFVDELVSNHREGILIEGLDTIQAIFTLFYNNGYSNEDILDGIRRMQDKNRQRGYYE